MAEPHSQNISFDWARHFINALYKQGVRHAIICPGSRSTPLTLAVAVHDGLQKTIILDERSAAFTALGIGKSTGSPAVLICTSGTAGSNFYPAVIESRQFGVPMIVLTADRPPHLRAIGANQAIDQMKLYGNYPVWFHDAGEPRSGTKDIRRLKQAARQAFYFSRRNRGTTHLNFAFRKPLEPDPSYFDKIKSENREEQNDPAPSFQYGSIVNSDLNGLKHVLKQSKRPVLIAGPEDPAYSLDEWGSSLAEASNIPILAEPGSQLISDNQTITGFAGYLRHTEAIRDLAPDLIIRLGQQPVTKALHRYLDHHRDVTHYHLTRSYRTQDAQLSADYTIEGIPPVVNTSNTGIDNDWIQKWRDYSDQREHKLQEVFKQSQRLTDGSVIYTLLQELPTSWSLCLSNSFPVRDAALFQPRNFADTDTYVNRGASGIDGVSSTATGVVRGSQHPALLITGDLAFLHDTNALLPQNLPHPLVIAIINNGGGSIFRMLPISAYGDTFSTYFETPQQVSIGAMSQTYGIGHQLITSKDELQGLSLTYYNKKSGIQLIEFQTDPEQSMHERHFLWDMESNS